MFNLKSIKKFSVALAGAAILSLSFGQAAYAASYKVVSGDSLFTIGRLFNTSAEAIMSRNNLSSATIYPGQILNINSDTYTVKSGDSLFLIANRYGISLDALRKANNQWSDTIYPGQALILPGVVSGTSTSTVTPQASTTQSKPVISYTAAEVDLLARLITAEAVGQPYSAQVAVGAVVVNRVQDSRFPNTVTSVIYQVSNGYYQFTPVKNGWINKPATETAKKAARDALFGADPSNGALYYFDKSANNTWLWSKPVAAKIGDLIFVY